MLDSCHHRAGHFCFGSYLFLWILAGVAIDGRGPLLLFPLSVVLASSEDLHFVGLHDTTQGIASGVAREYFIVLQCEVGECVPPSCRSVYVAQLPRPLSMLLAAAAIPALR